MNSNSVDPAIRPATAFAAVKPFDQLSIDPNGVYVFDFDGVISSRFEDDLYKLPASSDELELIMEASRHFGIRCGGMETRYQRHLVYQAAAWRLNLPIGAGRGMRKTVEASEIAALFVLTARSGWYAVERQRRFLEQMDVRPIEIFNLGRVTKEKQVDVISKEFHSRQVFVIEDSAAHLEQIAHLSLPNLELFLLLEEKNEQTSEASLRRHFCETIVTALKS